MAYGWLQQSRVGDHWSTVRGDQSPGVTYTAFIETSTGRLIAAGGGGQIMISDDAGVSWRYDVITIDGKPFHGAIFDMIRFGSSGSQLVATSIVLVESSNAFGLPLEGRTTLLFSGDDGNTWQSEQFPVSEALFGAATIDHRIIFAPVELESLAGRKRQRDISALGGTADLLLLVSPIPGKGGDTIIGTGIAQLYQLQIELLYTTVLFALALRFPVQPTGQRRRIVIQLAD